jgi:hypothetical protein
MLKATWCGAGRIVQKHLILGAIGLLLGVAGLSWVRPETSDGATMLVLIILLVVQAVGMVALRLTAPRPVSASAAKKLDRPKDGGAVMVDEVGDREP